MAAQKGLAPILIVILMAVLVLGAGYFIWSGYSNNRTKHTANTPSPFQSTPSPKTNNEATNSADTTNWKMFNDDRFQFQFKYPTKWNYRIVDKNTIILKDQNNAELIEIRGVYNLDVVGISYCGAYPKDPRCEEVVVDNISATIDWGSEGQASAIINIDGKRGIDLTLKQVTPLTKTTFNQILSTFKFIE